MHRTLARRQFKYTLDHSVVLMHRGTIRFPRIRLIHDQHRMRVNQFEPITRVHPFSLCLTKFRERISLLARLFKPRWFKLIIIMYQWHRPMSCAKIKLRCCFCRSLRLCAFLTCSLRLPLCIFVYLLYSRCTASIRA